MTPVDAILLGLAGFAAGGINAAAGGGSLITFPALLAIGLSPLAANVTNTLSVWPGYVGGTYGYRRELTGQRSRAIGLGTVAAIGAVGGAVALLTLSPGVFKAIVPLLLLLSSGLLFVQPRLARRLASKPADAKQNNPALVVAMLACGAYGAYFGGGLGVLMLGVLGALVRDSLQRLNGLKALLSLVINTIAAIAFIFYGPIDWAAVAVIAPASLLGGYAGASIMRRLPTSLLRAVVVTLGVVVAIILIVK